MALPNDYQRLMEHLARLASSDPTFSDDDNKRIGARNLIRESFVLVKPAADAMAADTTAYTAAHQIYMPRAWRFVAAYIQPQAALTAHATNIAGINVVSGDGAGGTAVVAASYSSVTGNTLAAGVKYVVTKSSTVADTRAIAGSCLGFNITKGSSGVVVPALTITVLVEWEGVDGYAA